MEATGKAMKSYNVGSARGSAISIMNCSSIVFVCAKAHHALFKIGP